MHLNQMKLWKVMMVLMLIWTLAGGQLIFEQEQDPEKEKEKKVTQWCVMNAMCEHFPCPYPQVPVCYLPKCHCL